MRTIAIAAALIVTGVLASEMSFAQSGWGWGTPGNNGCADLASQRGVNPKSRNGRRFIARCMQGSSGRSEQWHYGPSRNCPDDPKARSAYPAWMCR
jgi:hypothetical protein